MKQKKLRVLVETEFAKAVKANKATVDAENAFRLGRFCQDNHIIICEGQRQYVVRAEIVTRIDHEEYEFTLSRKIPGRLSTTTYYHLENDYVIDFILSHKSEIVDAYNSICERLIYREIVNGESVIYPEFPTLLKYKEILKEDIRKMIVDQTKHHWAAPVHAPKGKGKHKKVIFETEEYDVLPALRGSKSLLEGRNAIGNLYESDKWEMGGKRTHVAQKVYKLKRRATRRALRKIADLAIYVEEDDE